MQIQCIRHNHMDPFLPIHKERLTFQLFAYHECFFHGESIMSEKVTVYTTTYCGYCRAAKQFLASHDVAYQELDVTNDPDKRMWLVQTTGMRTVPQIFVGDTPVGGYQEMTKLHHKGEFVPLLEKNGIAHHFA